ncbi:MAG: alpha/beta fold hydrolase [Gammaproteobacteria bacterium]
MPQRMIRGCDYYVEENGTGQETVLFLHGLFMSGRAWHNQVLALRSRFRCVAIDLRGHSRSGSPSGGYDMDSLAEDIVKLIEVGGYAPTHIVGCAMGATIAMHVAVKRPELVRSLTLMSATMSDEEAGQRRQYWFSSIAMRLLGTRVFAGTLMRKLFGEHFRRDEDRKIQVNHWRTEFGKHNAKGIAQALRAYARREDLGNLVGRIRAPTLIYSGEQDRICHPRDGIALNSAISGSRYVTSPKAAHCPAVETPDEVSEALIGFLSSLQPRKR